MAFNLPPLPFPREPGTNNPYIATPDEAGGYVVPHGNYFKKKVGDINLWIPVSAEDPLPTENANIDVTLSALRNALLGTGNKTLTDLATALAPLATTEKQEELVSALGEILAQLQAGSPVSVTESVLPEGASTAEKQEALTALIGALDAVAVSDPAAAGAVIALLKGLLSRLQTLENKIDSFTTGEETVNTELKGSLVQVMQSAPVVGERTVTSTAAEMHAGASPLVGRYEMVVLNTSANTVYWGPTGVTIETGFPLLPNDIAHFKFAPEKHTAIYFIADGEFVVKVVELS